MKTSAINNRKSITRTDLTPKVKAKPEPHVQAESHPNDLCSTCAAAGECIYRNPGRPVHHCESYEQMPAIEPKKKVAPVKSEPDRFQGLCVTCSRREECTLSSTKGGVWHCEEYS